jgi:hypothetical protein
VPVGRSSQLPHQRVQDPLLVLLTAVGVRCDHRALALEQSRDRLIDRAGGEQVVGIDRILLADAVATVLSLIVLGGGPRELEEDDVRGARQREAVAGDLDRADDQLGNA